MRRALAWVVAAPLLGTGVLAAHDAAYALAGAPLDGAHAYLDHAPQVLLLACVFGLALLPLSGRPGHVSPWVFVAAAAATFVAQEHLERVVAEGGAVPWLLSSPVFLLGLVFQVPVALAVWVVVRWLLRAAASEGPQRRPRVPAISFSLPLLPVAASGSSATSGVHARAPPAPGLR